MNNSELTCYRCRKKGHIRPDCLENGPQMFTAQVIDKENESQHDEHKDQADPNSVDNDQENSRSDEVDNDNTEKDPIGS